MEINNVSSRRLLILQYLEERNSLSIQELTELIGTVSSSTISRDIDELEALGKVEMIGSGPNSKYTLIPGTVAAIDDSQIQTWLKNGIDISPAELTDTAPLVQVKILNPIAYIKKWLQDLLDNEGLKVHFSFEIKPLTVLGIVLVIITAGLGIKTLSLLFKYTPAYPFVRQILTKPDESRITAFEGQILISDEYTFLMRPGLEAIAVSTEEDLSNYHLKQVVATGYYNTTTNTLEVKTIYQVE